jgi:hypothetical protein
MDEDSLPLHVVGEEPPEMVVGQPALLEQYGGWLAGLHPRIWEEVRRMARAAGKKFQFDFRPAIKHLGLEYIIEQAGVKPIIEQIGVKRAVEEVGLKRVVDAVGLKRVVDEVGLKRVVQEVGGQQILDEMGLDWFLAQLTASQRQELKRRLE